MAANGLRVLAFCLVFCAGLPVAILREPVAGPNARGIAGLGGISDASRTTGGLSVGLDDNNPVVRFAQTRVGHILFSPMYGENCQRALFDNRTGAYGETAVVDCMRKAPDVAAHTERLQTLRKTFQR